MTDRVYSIDSMRILAIGFLVTLHTDPFRGSASTATRERRDRHLRTFAVPVFFMTSGCFFARKIARRDPIPSGSIPINRRGRPTLHQRGSRGQCTEPWKSTIMRRRVATRAFRTEVSEGSQRHPLPALAATERVRRCGRDSPARRGLIRRPPLQRRPPRAAPLPPHTALRGV